MSGAGGECSHLPTLDQPRGGAGRPAAQCAASRTGNQLSSEVLETCHRAEFASLPPSQIVPRLADQGAYLASESSFYRVLREADEQHARGRAKTPQQPRPPVSHCAKGPCEVWSGDITWLPGPGAILLPLPHHRPLPPQDGGLGGP
jgi:putative transposase